MGGGIPGTAPRRIINLTGGDVLVVAKELLPVLAERSPRSIEGHKTETLDKFCALMARVSNLPTT